MDEGYQLIHSGIEVILNNWRNHVLFTWKWWLVVCLSVIPWFLTFFFLKKEKRKQYFISSIILMVITSFLDISGLTYDLWRYYVTPMPILGGFFPWNFSIIPIFFIISYEVFSNLSPMVKSVIVALMYAYIGEPIADFLGLTRHHQWRHTYSVPIYIGLYLISYYGGLIVSQKISSNSKLQAYTFEEQEKINSIDKYQYAFEHSFDAIYLIEKKHWEKDFRFTEVNSAFCENMGYSKEEILKLNPRVISDQKSYNVDIKYRPLLKKGTLNIDTTFVTKSGEKKFVRLNVKVFWRKDKIEILSIADFLENKVTDFEAN